MTEARDETGAPLPTAGVRLRALLAALALRAGRRTSVAELVDDVWGDDPPQDAPAALQALVARLRRALGGRDTVTADPAGGYRLAAAPDDVDLHRFTRLAAQGGRELATDQAAAARTLRTALSLWRGPALADLPEPARTGHAAGPEARRSAALRDRIEADLRSGATAPAALLPEIEALIRASPYDEPLRAQQLRALRAAGRPADALAAYERTRRTLANALGTTPGPELTTLHTQLLNPTPSPQPPQSAPAQFPQSGPVYEESALAPGQLELGPWPAHPQSGPVQFPQSGPVQFPQPAPSHSARPEPGPDPAHSHPQPHTDRIQPTPAQPGPPSPTHPQSGPVQFPQSAPAQPQAPYPQPPPEAPRGNLRPRLTSFVGREPELAALREDLARLRLVTLTGPGGSGKTRLAEHAAAAHPEAGWIVELARLDHPAAVPGAVLSALGLRENSLVARENTAAADPTTQLVEHCAHRSLLLVLDNCEHVIGAAAELAEELLARCPGVQILATSREPLGVPGESLRPVEPLPDPVALRLLGDRGAAAPPRLHGGRRSGRGGRDLPASGRSAARHRAGRRPPAAAHPAPDRRPARRPFPAADQRCAYGPAPAADPAGRRRLVVGPSGRARTHRPAPSVRLRRRL
ncbi:BTAD domain-containing putative transcriptional regulator [Streptomyces sp. 147326]